MMANPCRAKNRATCWKHGNTSALNVATTKVALKSAKAEMNLTDGYDTYEDAREAVDKYSRRLAFFKGKPLYSNDIRLAHEELLEDADKVYNESLRRTARTPADAISLTTHYHDIVDKLEAESPKFSFPKSGEPIDRMKILEQTQVYRTEMESQGYIAVDNVGKNQTLFYKDNPADPTNFGTWTRAQSYYANDIRAAKEEREKVHQAAEKAYNAKRPPVPWDTTIRYSESTLG